MCAGLIVSERGVEELAGELTNAAYPVVLKHGVKGSWVDVELDVWKAFRRELSRRAPGKAHTAGVDDHGRLMLEDRSAQLTRVAYEIALRRGFSGSFVDVELDLWKALSLIS
jgi:hypothetical protein